MLFCNSVCEINKDELIDKIENVVLSNIEKQGYVREIDIFQSIEDEYAYSEFETQKALKEIIEKHNLMRLKYSYNNQKSKYKASNTYIITKKVKEDYNKEIAVCVKFTLALFLSKFYHYNLIEFFILKRFCFLARKGVFSPCILLAFLSYL